MKREWLAEDVKLGNKEVDADRGFIIEIEHAVAEPWCRFVCVCVCVCVCVNRRETTSSPKNKCRLAD